MGGSPAAGGEGARRRSGVFAISPTSQQSLDSQKVFPPERRDQEIDPSGPNHTQQIETARAKLRQQLLEDVPLAFSDQLQPSNIMDAPPVRINIRDLRRLNLATHRCGYTVELTESVFQNIEHSARVIVTLDLDHLERKELVPTPNNRTFRSKESTLTYPIQIRYLAKIYWPGCEN